MNVQCDVFHLPWHLSSSHVTRGFSTTIEFSGYEQVVSDVAEAREVDAVLQIWKLDGQRTLLMDTTCSTCSNTISTTLSLHVLLVLLLLYSTTTASTSTTTTTATTTTATTTDATTTTTTTTSSSSSSSSSSTKIVLMLAFFAFPCVLFSLHCFTVHLLYSQIQS